MAALDFILRNCSVFVDGVGLHGAVATLTPPKLTEKMEEHRGGGMDGAAEIPLGIEKIEAGAEIVDMDPQIYGLFGLRPGIVKAFTFKGHLVGENDGSERSVEVHLRGRIKEIDGGDWKPGELAKTKFQMAANFYKLTIGDVVIHEIDVLKGIRVVNGTDQNIGMRRSLGMAS